MSIMGLPKRLTDMQKRFAEFYVFGDEHGPLTKTEAAKRAGYIAKRMLDLKARVLRAQRSIHL